MEFKKKTKLSQQKQNAKKENSFEFCLWVLSNQCLVGWSTATSQQSLTISVFFFFSFCFVSVENFSKTPLFYYWTMENNILMACFFHIHRKFHWVWFGLVFLCTCSIAYRAIKSFHLNDKEPFSLNTETSTTIYTMKNKRKKK